MLLNNDGLLRIIYTRLHLTNTLPGLLQPIILILLEPDDPVLDHFRNFAVRGFAIFV